MNDDNTFEFSRDIAPKESISHVEYSGKYWFDTKWEADASVGEFTIYRDRGDHLTFTFNGSNFVDHTNYSLLARFLRWLLRYKENDMQKILFILAAICFGIDALKGVLGFSSPINWTAGGFCLLTIALWLV
jgi:hypothetical protein